MPVKLYHILPKGDPYGGSRNAAKAAIALREAQVPFETLNMSRERDLRPANGQYRRDINPNGVTPTLDDDGFLLWESAAVLTYIADNWAGGVLIPKDIREKARVHQWLAWEGATFQPGLMAVFLLVAAGDHGSDALVAARARYKDNLVILQNNLKGGDYVAGRFSVADIALGCSVSIGFHMGIDLKAYPEIGKWLRRLQQRAAFAAESSFSLDVLAGEQAALM